MAKEQKTADEIAAMVSEGIGMGGTTINVTANTFVKGDWHATVITAPRDAIVAR